MTDDSPDAASIQDQPADPSASAARVRSGFVPRLWTSLLVLGVFASAALVTFAFLLPDLDRYALAHGEAESSVRKVGRMLTWVAFSVRTFDLMGGVILLLLAVLVIARRRWFTAFIAISAAGVMLWPIVPRLLEVPAPSPYESDAPRLTIASINTLGSQIRSTDLRAFLESADPDVIVMIEYHTDLDRRERDWLKQRWPYFAAMPTDGAFGMAMYSRLKFVERPTIMPPLVLATRSGEMVRVPMIDPQIRAVVRVGEDASSREVVIQGAHPLPPRDATRLTEQRAVHRALANWAAAEARPRVLIGDLNATPRAQSSAWFTRAGLLESHDPSEIIDARTWPSGTSIPLLMGVRIDRALASRELYCERFTVGPDNGSDHRPIVVRYALSP